MYDVELVLRFFAMRNIEEFDYPLADILDDTLYALNKYSDDNIQQLKGVFIDALIKANTLFEEKAFRYYIDEKWSAPARMIYDPMMMVLAQEDIEVKDTCAEENIKQLASFYCNAVYEGDDGTEQRVFDGKHQSKDDIIRRAEFLNEFIRSLVK